MRRYDMFGNISVNPITTTTITTTTITTATNYY